MPKLNVERAKYFVTRRSAARRKSLIFEALEIDECQRGDAPETLSIVYEPAIDQLPATGSRKDIDGASTEMRLRPGCESR